MFRIGEKVIRRAEQGSETQEILYVYNVDPTEHMIRVGEVDGHPCGASWHPETKFVRPYDPQYTPREQEYLRKWEVTIGKMPIEDQVASARDLTEMLKLVRDLDEVSPESNGHYGRTNRDDWHVFGARTLHLMRTQGLSDPNIRELCRLLAPATEPPLEPVRLLAYEGVAADCPLCGISPSVELFRIEGADSEAPKKGLRLVPPCPVPREGIPIVTEIHIPSGRLAVANDLTDFFPPDPANYHARSGARNPFESRQITLAYAKVGLAYGFVGSTRLVLTADTGLPDRFVLGPQDPEKAALATVNTRMWWYSLADESQLNAHAKHLGEKKALKEEPKTVLDVRPGWYEVRHFYGIGMGYPENDVYATLRWVREPDQVPDPLWGLRSFLNFTSSAEDMLFSRILSTKIQVDTGFRPWDTLSVKDRTTLMHRAAVDLFTARSLWHQDKCVSGTPSEKAIQLGKTIGMPELHGQFYWGPSIHRLLDPKLVPIEKGAMNDDYIYLYANLLRCLISYGFIQLEPEQGHHLDPPNETDIPGILTKAVARYRELRKLHPKALGNGEFDEWIKDHVEVNAWIRNLAETSKGAA